MKAVFDPIINIRRKVFAQIAKMAYENLDLKTYLEEAVFEILPGELPMFRESIFKERAIVGERLRMGLGLPLRRFTDNETLSKDSQTINRDERILQEAMVQVMPFACEACPSKAYQVTETCRKCFAHPCIQVCPVKAVSMGKNTSLIDQEKCIRCGRCKEVCPYNAIIVYDRPCAAACGVNAVESDHLNRARINQEKCVSCGMCLTNCPFGAIADKTEIYQLVKAIQAGHRVSAIIAPAFVGQFGPLAKPEMIVEGIKRLGIDQVIEVSLGADIESLHEAKEYMEEVPAKHPFLGTSCCPSWAMAARRNFPELSDHISSSSTPMVSTARYLKSQDPAQKIVFIGPCIAKKVEASSAQVRPYIDFVITFEELIGMFAARDIELENVAKEAPITDDASGLGRGFAVSGGVAQAVRSTIHRMDPSFEVKTQKADGLFECMKMLKIAKAGKYDGYLLEGMGCPGGCIGGPGTLIPLPKAQSEVKRFADSSAYATALDSPYSGPSGN